MTKNFVNFLPELSAFAARQVLKSKTSSPKSPARQNESSAISDATTLPNLNAPDLEKTIKPDSQNVLGDTTPQDGTDSTPGGINLRLDEEGQLTS